MKAHSLIEALQKLPNQNIEVYASDAEGNDLLETFEPSVRVGIWHTAQKDVPHKMIWSASLEEVKGMSDQDIITENMGVADEGLYVVIRYVIL